MLLVSVRENFTATTDFSETDQYREVAQPVLEPFTPLTLDQFKQRVAGKKCLVLVHGYRNEAQSAVAAYGKVADMLNRTAPGPGAAVYDEIIGYLWPGGWLRVSFFFAVFRANCAAKRFEKLLLALADAGAVVDVQTHSLGARVAAEALDRQRARIRFLHLTAPAIDDESVEQRKEYGEACAQCQGVYVFHSEKDQVLKVGYRMGDFPEFDEALGFHGPQHPSMVTANTRVVDCRDIVEEHGGYRSAPEYFDYWLSELRGPGSPQFVRLPRNR